MPLVDYDNANYPGIRIDDSGGTFVLSVREALNQIISQPVGLALLTQLSAHAPAFGPWGGGVKIYRAALSVDQGGSRAAAVNEVNAKNGTGSASGVAWNSNIWVVPEQGQRPPFIGLAHELIHAWHNALGIKKANYDDEEAFTVGLGAYMIPAIIPGPGVLAITENMIRLEHNVPIRHRY